MSSLDDMRRDLQEKFERLKGRSEVEKKPYPINVNGMIELIEQRLKETPEYDTEEYKLARQHLKGFLAMFYSLKEQGIETTDSSKVDLKKLMSSLGIEYGV